MQFRETTQEDINFLADHSVSRGISKYQPECIDYSYTLERRGNPLAIGGFKLINRTTAWCWLNMADCSDGHIVVIYRVISEWIDEFVKTHKIKRLQAYVETDFPEAMRLVEHLGFKWESDMEDFIDNKDAYMYVRLTKWQK